MLIAQKGNKQLKIEDRAKEFYVGNGWDIMDEEGNVIVQATSKGVKLNDSQKKVLKVLSTMDASKDLTVGAAKTMAEVLGVEFVDKDTSGETLQKAYVDIMGSIKY